MALLFLTEEVDVVVVSVKLLACTGDAFLGGTKVDVILLVIGLHKKFLRFSISRNGGLWVLPKMGIGNRPKS